MATMALRNLPGHNDMVDHILASWDSATEAEIAEYSSWYSGAWNICVSLERSSGIDAHRLAGAMAWLSPQTSFSQNVADLMTLVEAYVTGEDVFAQGISNYADNILKAEQCLQGNFESLLIGPKTRALKVRKFWRNIVGLDDHAHVTVDRHAVAIAVGNYDRAHNGRFVTVAQPEGAAYRAVERAYVTAAELRGVSPKVMQAVVWCVRRGTGA